MDVRLLYVADCPNWRLADARLRQALAEIDPTVTVTYQVVATPEEAQRAGFRGSPTILVNGRDPLASPRDPVGLTCRIYQDSSGDGRAPSVEQLTAGLADAS